MSYNWSNTTQTSAAWSSSSNWGGSGYPNGSSDTATITTSGVGDVDNYQNISLSENITLNSITFNKSASDKPLVRLQTSNGSKLNISGTNAYITVSATDSTYIIDCPLNINAVTLNVTVASGSVLKFNGTVTSTINNVLNISGAGTVLFAENSPLDTTINVSSDSTLKMGSSGSSGLVSGYWTDFSLSNTFAGVRSDGTLWTWGVNTNNQAGRLDTTSRTFPNKVSINPSDGVDNDWKQVSCGGGFTCAIKTDGTLWTCGSTTSNRLGRTVDGTYPQYRFCKVGTDTDWKYVSASNGTYAIALKTDGTLWSWGTSTTGHLGLGATTTVTVPTKISAPTPIANESPAPLDNDWAYVRCSMGAAGPVLALKTDGTLWAWGPNGSNAKIGVGDTTTSLFSTPQRVGSQAQIWSSPPATGFGGTLSSTWKFKAAGSTLNSCFAVDTSGKLWAWGANTSGVLGIGATEPTQTIPVQVGTATNWVDVAGSSLNLVTALDSNGKIWGCGVNTNGQLGMGYNTVLTAFTQQPDDGRVYTRLSGGLGYSGALSDIGQIVISGGGTTGSYYSPGGLLNDRNKLVPSKISGGWSKIAVGGTFTLGIDTSGNMWAWGANSNGYLAQGNTTRYYDQKMLVPGSNWVDVYASTYSCYGIKEVSGQRTLWGWGINSEGQIGLGSTTPAFVSTPTQIGTDTNWSSLTGFNTSVIGLKTNGTLYGWGANNGSQLGVTGTTITTPTLIASPSGGGVWSKVSIGFDHALAISSLGQLYGWGTSTSGSNQNGAGSTKTAPFLINSGTNWVNVAAGYRYSLALKQESTNVNLFAWGAGLNSQLGNGGVANVSTIPSSTISAINNWQSISAGYRTSVGTTTDGKLYTWGTSLKGAIGLDSTTAVYNTPQNITTEGNGWTSAKISYFNIGDNEHVAALKGDVLYTFGSNDDSQLGFSEGGGNTNYLIRDCGVINNDGHLIIDMSGNTTIPITIKGNGIVEYTGTGTATLSTVIEANKVVVSSGKMYTSLASTSPTFEFDVASGAVAVTKNQNMYNIPMFIKKGQGDLVLPFGYSPPKGVITHEGGRIIMTNIPTGECTVNCTDTSNVVVVTNSTGSDTGVLNVVNGTLQIGHPNTIPDITSNTGTTGTFVEGKYNVVNGQIDYATSTDVTLLNSYSGKVRKSNGGKITTSGTYTNPITVTGGNLNVSSTLTGALTVESGGIVSGSGTVANLTVKNNGTMSVGNSPGLLTVTGDLVLEAGSVFDWELIDNTNDTIQRGVKYDAVHVDGNLSIDAAATLNILLEQDVDYTNSLWSADKSWNVFEVVGTTTGTFGAPNVTYTGVGTPPNTFTNSFSTSPSGSDLYITYTLYQPVTGGVFTMSNGKSEGYCSIGITDDSQITTLESNGYTIMNMGKTYLGGSVDVEPQVNGGVSNLVVVKGTMSITGDVVCHATTTYVYFGDSWRMVTDTDSVQYQKDVSGTWTTVHKITKS